MVSGFNTEIEHEGTVYHVQTEPRRQEGIETSVYVKGAVIHSLKTLPREFGSSLQPSEQQLNQLVEDQHRRVIAEIRAGKIKFQAASCSGASGLQ